MLYEDKEKSIDSLIDQLRENNPDFEAIDNYGNIHQAWRITDPDTISKISNDIANKNLLIADGHHRYETYLDYRKQLKQNNQPLDSEADCNYALATLVNTYDKGLSVLPTHRLVKNISVPAYQLIDGLSSDFDIEKFKISSKEDLANIQDIMKTQGAINIVFGVYGGGDSIYLLTYKNNVLPQDALEEKRSEAWRKLDLAILHKRILEQELGIDEEALRQESNVEYYRDAKKAFSKVENGDADLLFLVNPTKISSVIDVAHTGDRMPQKSTDFYPKLLTGLMFYRMEK